MSEKHKEKDEELPCIPQVRDILKKDGYTFREKLGQGTYGKVYRAKFYEKDIAVKVINLDKAAEITRNKYLPREIFALRTIRHPNVIAVYDIYKLANMVYIFMELAAGDMVNIIEQEGPIPEKRCQTLFKEIVDGLKYVHDFGVTHRDLKVDNILIDKNGHAKITDFGFARRVYERELGRRLLSETFCGTTAYVAPEVLAKTSYNPELADVWSLGVVLFVMLNDSFPFDDNDKDKMLKDQRNRNYKHKEKVENKLSEGCKELVDKILEPQPKKRITLNQLLEHKWLVGVKNNTPFNL